jgi:hypothetical protein
MIVQKNVTVDEETEVIIRAKEVSEISSRFDLFKNGTQN